MTKEFIERRNKLLCKYLPEVMTVKTEDNMKDAFYEGLVVGYYSGQRDSKNNKYDELFENCKSIYQED